MEKASLILLKKPGPILSGVIMFRHTTWRNSKVKPIYKKIVFQGKVYFLKIIVITI